ncbi:GNAT family N-acetyltransferase [Shewanella psychrotolerans]|uniref:GNAT family N-acetyltransferase n=1 Tax=Shewanella psychrotolerans TaxID=2864206 RepID=UPI001C661524|nr:GNAT family N-acetyltransferase [Shewanella psychrotolerans]QYK02060.1 GNAT family N-acetyltransferase [Shewanella psychrotolerans]
MQLDNGEYYITDDSERVNIETLKILLESSYWASTRSIDVIKTTIDNSVCFSVYKAKEQIGFGRVVTDYATFGYIADVIIDTEHKGNGIGKWLMDVIVNDERWKGKFLMLATDDAHSLYKKYGFQGSTKLMSTKI